MNPGTRFKTLDGTPHIVVRSDSKGFVARRPHPKASGLLFLVPFNKILVQNP